MSIHSGLSGENPLQDSSVIQQTPQAPKAADQPSVDSFQTVKTTALSSAGKEYEVSNKTSKNELAKANNLVKHSLKEGLQDLQKLQDKALSTVFSPSYNLNPKQIENQKNDIIRTVYAGRDKITDLKQQLGELKNHLDKTKLTNEKLNLEKAQRGIEAKIELMEKRQKYLEKSLNDPEFLESFNHRGTILKKSNDCSDSTQTKAVSDFFLDRTPESQSLFEQEKTSGYVAKIPLASGFDKELGSMLNAVFETKDASSATFLTGKQLQELQATQEETITSQLANKLTEMRNEAKKENSPEKLQKMQSLEKEFQSLQKELAKLQDENHVGHQTRFNPSLANQIAQIEAGEVHNPEALRNYITTAEYAKDKLEKMLNNPKATAQLSPQDLKDLNRELVALKNLISLSNHKLSSLSQGHMAQITHLSLKEVNSSFTIDKSIHDNVKLPFGSTTFTKTFHPKAYEEAKNVQKAAREILHLDKSITATLEKITQAHENTQSTDINQEIAQFKKTISQLETELSAVKNNLQKEETSTRMRATVDVFIDAWQAKIDDLKINLNSLNTMTQSSFIETAQLRDVVTQELIRAEQEPLQAGFHYFTAQEMYLKPEGEKLVGNAHQLSDNHPQKAALMAMVEATENRLNLAEATALQLTPREKEIQALLLSGGAISKSDVKATESLLQKTIADGLYRNSEKLFEASLLLQIAKPPTFSPSKDLAKMITVMHTKQQQILNVPNRDIINKAVAHAHSAIIHANQAKELSESEAKGSSLFTKAYKGATKEFSASIQSLKELEQTCATHPDLQTLLKHSQTHLDEVQSDPNFMKLSPHQEEWKKELLVEISGSKRSSAGKLFNAVKYAIKETPLEQLSTDHGKQRFTTILLKEKTAALYSKDPIRKAEAQKSLSELFQGISKNPQLSDLIVKNPDLRKAYVELHQAGVLSSPTTNAQGKAILSFKERLASVEQKAQTNIELAKAYQQSASEQDVMACLLNSPDRKGLSESRQILSNNQGFLLDASTMDEAILMEEFKEIIQQTDQKIIEEMINSPVLKDKYQTLESQQEEIQNQLKKDPLNLDQLDHAIVAFKKTQEEIDGLLPYSMTARSHINAIANPVRKAFCDKHSIDVTLSNRAISIVKEHPKVKEAIANAQKLREDLKNLVGDNATQIQEKLTVNMQEVKAKFPQCIVENEMNQIFRTEEAYEKLTELKNNWATLSKMLNDPKILADPNNPTAEMKSKLIDKVKTELYPMWKQCIALCTNSKDLELFANVEAMRKLITDPEIGIMSSPNGSSSTLDVEAQKMVSIIKNVANTQALEGSDKSKEKAGAFYALINEYRTGLNLTAQACSFIPIDPEGKKGLPQDKKEQLVTALGRAEIAMSQLHNNMRSTLGSEQEKAVAKLDKEILTHLEKGEVFEMQEKMTLRQGFIDQFKQHTNFESLVHSCTSNEYFDLLREIQTACTIFRTYNEVFLGTVGDTSFKGFDADMRAENAADQVKNIQSQYMNLSNSSSYRSYGDFVGYTLSTIADRLLQGGIALTMNELGEKVPAGSDLRTHLDGINGKTKDAIFEMQNAVDAARKAKV